MELYNIQEPESSIVLGIDFGTTHSLVGVSNDGENVKLIELQGNAMLKSMVASIGKKLKVGIDAVDYKDCIMSIKRDFSRKGADIENAIIITSNILGFLRKEAGKALGVDLKKAVITVPARFDDKARYAIRKAAELSGIEVLRLVNEPTAAMLAYGEDYTEGNYLVYDFGGGTFDVSILRTKGGVLQVVATNGDLHLGGDDIDDIILGKLLGNNGKKECSPAERRIIHEIKVALVDNEVWEGKLVENGDKVKVTRGDLIQWIKPLIDRSIEIVKKTLEEVSLSFSDIEEVILAGGTSKLFFLKDILKSYFSCKINSSINPDEVVLKGAAIQAYNLTTGSSKLLLDVVPLSLGIETLDGHVEVLIPRSTQIPTEYRQIFTTFFKKQRSIKINIVQGEGSDMSNYRSLASFEIKSMRKNKDEQVKIEVCFRIDADGILNVTAKEIGQDNMREVMVQPHYDLDEKKVLKEKPKVG